MGKLDGSTLWKKINITKKIQGESSNKKKRLYIYTGKQADQEKQALQILEDAVRRYPLGNANYRNLSNPNEAHLLSEKPFLLREGNKYTILSYEEHVRISRLQEQNSCSDKNQAEMDLELMKIYPRLASVDKLKQNHRLTEDEFKKLTTHGGQLQLSSTNPYRPRLVNGQIVWDSSDSVIASHVSEVIKKTSQYGRSLHVNTGTHGDKSGNTVSQYKELAEAKFSKEDLEVVWNLDNVSVHIVSQAAPALSSDTCKHIDIINAWCYSEKSKHISSADDDNITKIIKNIFKTLTSREEKKEAQSSTPPQNSSMNASSESGQAFAFKAGNASNFGNSNNFHQPHIPPTPLKRSDGDHGVKRAAEESIPETPSIGKSEDKQEKKKPLLKKRNNILSDTEIAANLLAHTSGLFSDGQKKRLSVFSIANEQSRKDTMDTVKKMTMEQKEEFSAKYKDKEYVNNLIVKLRR